MCMACEEMQFYDHYMEAVEAARRQEQPWECEVTLFKDGVPVEAKPAAPSPFACDPTE